MIFYKKINLKAVFIIYFTGLFILLFYPFDFQFPFYTTVFLANQEGIEITGIGALITDKPATKLHQMIANGKGLTIEVWVSTEDFNQKGPARIVSYSKDTQLRNFTLGQSGTDLVVRLRTERTSLNGVNPVFSIRNVFNNTLPIHIAVTYDFQFERIYINGNLRKTFKGPGGKFTNWDANYPLILANEATGNRSWRGKIYFVAVFNHPLTAHEIANHYKLGRVQGEPIKENLDEHNEELVVLYRFKDRKSNLVLDHSQKEPLLNLNMVNGYYFNHKIPLLFTEKDLPLTISRFLEMVGNIIIFVPIGFIFVQIFRKSTMLSRLPIVAVFATGFLISLFVEIIQYYSITRISSIFDVIYNTLGVLCGILLYKYFLIYQENKLRV